MSSTSGGPPDQDAAAKPPVSLTEAHEVSEARSASSKASESTSPRNRDPVSSTPSGLADVTPADSNVTVNAYSDEMDQASSTAQQKADENLASDSRLAGAQSSSESSSHGAELRQGHSNLELKSKGGSQSGNQENGEALEAREIDGAKAEQRTVYETSHTTTASTPDQTLENTSKTADDTTQTPPLQIPARRRVKVYSLSTKTGVWDDQGTGSVDIRAWDHEPEIIVISEVDPSNVLLESPILLETSYHMQQDSLIVWNESREGSKEGVDLAISFQETQGCTEIWDRIMEIQNKFARPIRGRLGGTGLSNSLDGNVDDLFCKSDDEEDDYMPSVTRLPPAKPRFISDIHHFFLEHFMVARARLSMTVLKANYIESLCDLFKMAEDLGDVEDLHRLFEIFKILVMLNYPRILDRLFHNDNVMQVMGALEYDPDLVHRPQHRHFLEKVVVFHQVVSLPSYIVDQIHRSFRIQYLKDVVLARILDEATFTFLNSIIMFSNNKIAADIRREESILRELFEKMKSLDTTPEQLKDLLKFLNELCEISKHLEQEQKMSFYSSLHEHGLLEVLTRTLSHTDMRLVSVEILLASLDTDGRQVRKYLVNTNGSPVSLVALLIRSLHEDEDTAAKNAITDLLRLLLDVATEDVLDQSEFLNMFYTYHLDSLLSPILVHQPGAETSTLKDSTSLLMRNLIDFIGFILMHHGTRARNYILDHKILARMNPLIAYADKHVALSVVRSLRLVLGLEDSLLNKAIIKDNLLDRVVDLFLANASKYNLTNSSCLELFAQMHKNSSSPPVALVTHFVQRYYDRVKNVPYTNIFTVLKTLADDRKRPSSEYDLDPSGTPPLQFSSLSGRTGPASHYQENERFQRSLDELEYFESGDEDEPHDNDDLHTHADAYAPASPQVSPTPQALSTQGDGESLPQPTDATPASSSTAANSPLVFRYNHEDQDEEDATLLEKKQGNRPPANNDEKSLPQSSVTASSHSASEMSPSLNSSQASPSATDEPAPIGTADATEHPSSPSRVPINGDEDLPSPSGTVYKKRKSPSFENEGTHDEVPSSKRPKGAALLKQEEAVDTVL